MTDSGHNTISLVVSQRETAADGIVALELRRPDGGTLPDWGPGAHIDVQTQDDDGRPVTRQYSLCGPATGSTWRIAVLAAAQGRGGSRWLHQHAHRGTRLVCRPPGNHFALEATDAPVVLVAGGIGITPLMTMAHALHARGTRFRLHYHVRRRSGAAFLDELLSAPFAAQLHLSIDDDSPPALDALFSSSDALGWVYTCGPVGFMHAVTSAAIARGVPAERIRKELFAPDTTATEPSAAVNRAFRVRLHSTGQEITVRADQSVVQALAEADIEIVVSCEQGFCGSCLTRVIDGLPEHRDQFMLPEEQARNDSFTPCCSRALTDRLVLDL